MYQLTTGSTILRLADNAFIPQDQGNADYREYLDWLAAGNTPEPPPGRPEQPIQRAREDDGTFKADDPSTPDVNEAWA